MDPLAFLVFFAGPLLLLIHIIVAVKLLKELKHIDTSLKESSRTSFTQNIMARDTCAEINKKVDRNLEVLDIVKNRLEEFKLTNKT